MEGNGLIRLKVINVVEQNKVSLVKVLKILAPFLIPILRTAYLRFRRIDVKGNNFGLPESSLTHFQRSVLSVQVEYSQEQQPIRVSRPNLLVLVLTDTNKFESWFNPNISRNWDFWVLDLRTTSSSDIHLGADAYIRTRGFVTKTLLFSGLRTEICNQNFQYLTFFDDDLESSVEDINAIFDCGQKFGFELYQPSLTADSEVNHENLREVPTSPGFRSVPLVEIMCPFLSLNIYSRIADLSILAPSGWGFDLAISSLLYSVTKKNPIVLDSLAVKHGRKSDPQNGSFYRYLSENGVSPQMDLVNLSRYLGLDTSEVLLRNISHINDFINPKLEILETTNWAKIQEKSSNAKIAILMTKNELDLLGLWISHHFDYFDLIFVVDDGSVDGTREYIRQAMFTEKIIEVRRKDREGYRQREITTWIARFIAIRAPKAIIMPLDTDEMISEDILSGKFAFNEDDNYWHHNWQVAVPLVLDEHMIGLEDLFLSEIRDHSEHKIIFRANLILDGFEIVQGNHDLVIPGSNSRSTLLASKMAPPLIHIPVRSRDQILFKVDQGSVALKATSGRNPHEGSHWLFMEKEIKNELSDRKLLGLSSNYLTLPNSKIIYRTIIRISGTAELFPAVRRITFKEMRKGGLRNSDS